MSSDQTIKVAVRIRPLVPLEQNKGSKSIVHKTPKQPQVVVQYSGSKASDNFTYNYVFAPEDTQEMIYENAVKSMVLKLFDGYNVTILAYGQTGSGKTHTMGTTFNGTMDDEMGVIPRAVNEIFDTIQTMPDHDFVVNCSFVELYQEKLYDLLSKSAREQSVVDIREVDGKVVIPNLTETTVGKTSETIDCLMRGSADRAVSATAMNAQSSRSHAIFTVTVQKVPKENPTAATIAKFHLVDLAGSERSKKTQTVGEQFKEGVQINKGLLALGNVINALGSDKCQNGDKKGTGHVGYRDSKLTRLLQDSLGGNSMTLMIACVSPADSNYDETVGTLRYADRAKRIKNKPVVNEDPQTAEINRLKTEILQLNLKLSFKPGSGSNTIEKCMKCDDPPTKMQLLKENRDMAEKMQVQLFEMAHRENVLTEYEETIESLNNKIAELKQQIINLDKANTADMSPEQLKDYEDKVHMVTETILELTHHMKERNDCIVQNTKSAHSQSINSSNTSFVDCEELAQTNDKYIKQQTEYQNELREVKQELNVKEKLHGKLIENYEKFRQLNDEAMVKAKMSEYESMIAKMEKEQEELKLALRNKNGSISVKLAEERRKRVQQLETQIAEYKKKNKIQSQLLKQHEKDNDQIKKLSSEIVDMKQTKVKLIKKMKAESDEFRQMKTKYEKELAQLHTKERKMQSEAVKKDLLHEKQRIVLQRKFEESTAANKRMKEALLKVQKNKENKNKGALKPASWLNDKLTEEIEVLTSIVDIRKSREQLLETRAELTGRLNKAKRQRLPNKDMIKQIQEEIEMHNAQITDLQSQISANDLDAKIKSIQDCYQSLPESRTVVKYLLNNLVENRNTFNKYFAQNRDLKHDLETAEEETKQLVENAQKMADDYKKKLEEAQNERNRLAEENVEKESLLLKALSSEGSQSAVIDLLQQQLSEKQAEIERIKQSKIRYKRPIRPRLEDITYELNDTADSYNGFTDDDTIDPDWVKTPLVRTKRKTTRSMSHSPEEVKTVNPRQQSKKKPQKRSKNGCNCKTGCKEGQCGCRKNTFGCTDACGCLDHGNCSNVFGKSGSDRKRERSSDESVSGNSGDDKENEGNVIDVDDEEEIPCTPQKKPRTTEEIIHPYVYSHKKRNPIFTAKGE